MITIRHLLDTKGYAVWSISPNATVFEAIELLAEKDIGAVLVMDGEKLEGILSERDYARRLILKGRMSQDTEVGVVAGIAHSRHELDPARRAERLGITVGEPHAGL